MILTNGTVLLSVKLNTSNNMMILSSLKRLEVNSILYNSLRTQYPSFECNYCKSFLKRLVGYVSPKFRLNSASNSSRLEGVSKIIWFGTAFLVKIWYFSRVSRNCISFLWRIYGISQSYPDILNYLIRYKEALQRRSILCHKKRTKFVYIFFALFLYFSFFC